MDYPEALNNQRRGDFSSGNANSRGFQTTKLLLFEGLHDTIESVQGSSTMSYVLLRNGGGGALKQTTLKECIDYLKPILAGEGDSPARDAIMELEAMNYRLSLNKKVNVKPGDKAMDYRVELALVMKKIQTFETKLRKLVPVVVRNPKTIYKEGLSDYEWKAIMKLEFMAVV